MARGPRVLLRLVVAVLALVAVDQVLVRTALSDDHFLGRPVAPFDPPLFAASQWRALDRVRSELDRGEVGGGRYDAELGWCNKPDSGFGEYRYDWAGARIATAPLSRTKRLHRIVTIGCSMTHGDEVAAQESWCARLGEHPGIEVANLGVAAFGLDQALMRLRRDGWPLEPDEVWMGVMPGAVLRITTMFRPILTHWSQDIAFKPRLVLEEDGTLREIPNPAPNRRRIVELLTDQDSFLRSFAEHDHWVRRAPLAYAPRGSSWMHGSFAARMLLTLHERSGRRHQDCFEEGTEIERLFSALVRTTARECAERGVAFRVVVVPGQRDLEKVLPDGRWYWDDWSERMRDEGMVVLDVSSALVSAGIELDELFAPGGHYTAAGNAIVADALAAAASGWWSTGADH